MKKVLLFTCIFLSACATSRLDLYSPTLGRYNFNYNVESPGKTGVIQVFDDSKNTYFKLYRQGRDLRNLSFYDSNTNKSLKVKPVQRNLIMVLGVHNALHVKSGGLRTNVTRLKPETKVGI